jgi:diguanylate cyclase (GGDEF)-like protein
MKKMVEKVFIKISEKLFGNYPERGIEYRTFIVFVFAGIMMNLLGLISDSITMNYTFYSLFVKILFTFVLTVSFLCARFMKIWRWTVPVTVLFIPLFFLPGGWLTNGGIIGGFQYYPVIMGMMIAAMSYRSLRNVAVMLHFIILGILIFTPEFRDGIADWSSARSLELEVAMNRRMAHLMITMIMTTLLFIIYVKRLRRQHWLLKHHSEKLKKLSITDDLTGVGNHRYIMDELVKEVERAARYGSDLCVLMLDIDNFKKINDTKGHLCGDNVLKSIGETLAKRLRNSDRIGRYGGEEFLIILPEQTLDNGLIVAEKLRELISMIKVESCGIESVTASIGVALWKKDEPVESILSRADKAMYLAKESGRNRVCS